MSQYFLKRRGLLKGGHTLIKCRRYPKLGAVVDCLSHVIVALRTGRGPTPDIHELKDTFRQLPTSVSIKLLLADAGYDSEENHRYARHRLHAKTLIPPWHGRPSEKPAAGRFRRLMQRTFKNKPAVFGQRWQIETVFSMLKRNLGSALTGRSGWAQGREIWLKALTHNLSIAIS